MGLPTPPKYPRAPLIPPAPTWGTPNPTPPFGWASQPLLALLVDLLMLWPFWGPPNPSQPLLALGEGLPTPRALQESLLIPLSPLGGTPDPSQLSWRASHFSKPSLKDSHPLSALQESLPTLPRGYPNPCWPSRKACRPLPPLCEGLPAPSGAPRGPLNPTYPPGKPPNPSGPPGGLLIPSALQDGLSTPSTPPVGPPDPPCPPEWASSPLLSL